MALQQTVETAAGALVSYWMIMREELDYLASTRTVVLAGFVSEEKRRAGRSPVIPLSFVFRPTDFPANTDFAAVPRSALYAAVRAAIARQASPGVPEPADGGAPVQPDARVWIAALAAAQDC